ncbi:helix-turn-helix domain-containing protein [Staphylococcus pseudoxylosus]|uniref:helix-turn-helix domain-containing protein n=1 Tax=Staphylococcus pseudoxylosus TaxID=2282419 RepID=UPI000D1DDE88|nr:helix-turn-helix domain-containing protein [Staphylococcus pseudoxylosus]MBM2657587.1 helix-turn-helix domain-containing protein [Staphylococcus pseudoxylosus]MEB5782431.1 helix-turn-helix transcriptional regulator [Staphylococcus pseudoxylosus]PTI83661.1 XRE family transcriptional regulator [Staphylococcus xylosus]
MTTTDFGVSVRTELLIRGITLTEFARTLGISTAYLSDILRGRRDAKEQKHRIAKLLNLENELKEE